MIKYCDRCQIDTNHRLVNDKRPKKGPYHACKICLERNSVAHRRRHWYKYLAQKANARKRKGSIKLSGDDVLNTYKLQGERCALTNTVLDVNDKWWRPSLDRIDSSKGYTIDNIRVVAWIVNHCRGNLNDELFLDMCRKVSNRSVNG